MKRDQRLPLHVSRPSTARSAPPFVISDFVVCVDTEEEVGEYTDDYFAKQFYQVATHYEWGGDHFKTDAVLLHLRPRWATT